MLFELLQSFDSWKHIIRNTINKDSKDYEKEKYL